MSFLIVKLISSLDFFPAATLEANNGSHCTPLIAALVVKIYMFYQWTWSAFDSLDSSEVLKDLEVALELLHPDTTKGKTDFLYHEIQLSRIYSICKCGSGFHCLHNLQEMDICSRKQVQPVKHNL